jgi:hypothetical protein
VVAFSCIKRTSCGRSVEALGFARLVRDLISFGELKVLDQHRYQHRLAANGKPLHYLAIVARKSA